MASRGSNKNLKYALIAIAAVVVIFLILVVVKSPTTQNLNASDSLAPQSLIDSVSNLVNKAIQSVGIGTATTKPKVIDGPKVTQNGKPLVVYMGAEYCPYCATERWPTVVALTRFGSFSNLKVTHSSSTDVYPDTQTFSFHGATYTSNYISFSAVEMYSNIPQGNSYTTLDKPTAEEQSLMNTYDAPPYVPSTDSGAIPFIYFGGKYMISGASYSPTVLQGKSAQDIATALLKPSDPISQGVYGAANLMTAAICAMTNNQPSNVCTSTIQSIESSMSK
jgi:thiol-disulfide isomerase/thioredoxin